MNMKATKLLSIALLGAATIATQVHAQGNKVAGCAGYQVVCDQSINAVGDRLPWDVSDVSAKDLGSISQQKTIQLQFPELNSKLLYNFKLTEGALAGKNVEALFVTFDLNNISSDLPGNVANELQAGMQKYPESNVGVKVYRRLEGEKLWTEMGASFGKMSPKSAPVMISPDGEIDISNLQPAGHPKPSIIDFGAML